MAKSKHTQEYYAILELLSTVREQAELRQSDVAERLGVPQSYVSKIELGHRRIDVIELREYCRAIGIGLDEFIIKLEAKLNASKSRLPE